MMKKRRITAVLILCVMLAGLYACGSKEQEDAVGTERETTTDTETEDKDEQGQGMKAGSGSQENTAGAQESGPVTITVYVTNDDATQMVEEEVRIDALSPENVVNALIEKEIVPEGTRVLSLEQSEKDGAQVLDVDFSQELSDHMNSMGSTGEYMTMGGICNTFLGAYGCEKINITVEGELLTTGHMEYTGYQKFYK